MFVRFRAVRHRLVVNLVDTRRIGGKVVNDHIMRLGSVALPEPISAAERILFWRDLKERWRDLVNRLGNRVTASDRKKALAAIHQRIPKPNEAEEHAARVEAVRGRFASDAMLRDMVSDSIARNEELITRAKAKIAEDSATLANTAHATQEVNWSLVRMLAGERVEGDDEAMINHLVHTAAKREAAIRAAPRPAARGERRAGEPAGPFLDERHREAEGGERSFEIGRLPLESPRRADPPQDGHGLPDLLDTGH
jgi:hypothetical protein